MFFFFCYKIYFPTGTNLFYGQQVVINKFKFYELGDHLNKYFYAFVILCFCCFYLLINLLNKFLHKYLVK